VGVACFDASGWIAYRTVNRLQSQSENRKSTSLTSLIGILLRRADRFLAIVLNNSEDNSEVRTVSLGEDASHAEHQQAAGAWSIILRKGTDAVIAIRGGSPQARSVDPTRHISQYAHSAWRTQDGVFGGTPKRIT
jgi:hypothetical protein